jgi:hypothetical protein
MNDLASQMLSALTDEPAAPTPQRTVPLEEQKRYLCQVVASFGRKDRIAIGNTLVLNQRRDALQPCAEGTVINLDTLPPELIDQMYNLAEYKKSRLNRK